MRTRAGLLTEVARGHVDYALLPVTPGEPGAPHDLAAFFADLPPDLHIYAEVQAHLPDALLAACEPSEVRTIFATAGAFERCARWLATQYPAAKRVITPSDASAVIQARDRLAHAPGSGAAALAPRLCGELHGLSPLFPDVQDDPVPRARHLVLSRARARPTGADRTTVLLTLDERPGALATALSALATCDVTGLALSPEATIPGRGALVLLDLAGHHELPPLAPALERLARACRHARVIGSYPRAASTRADPPGLPGAGHPP